MNTPAPRLARYLVRLMALVTAAGVIVSTSDRAAWACTCADQPPATLARLADVVFTGTVSSLAPVEPEVEGPDVVVESVAASFRVEQVFKGDVDPETTVTTFKRSASCGYPFAESRRYTVFADAEGGSLRTGLCSGTTRERIEADEYRLPEPDVISTPLAAAEPAAPGPSEEGRGWAILMIVLAGLFAATLVAVPIVLLVRRR